MYSIALSNAKGGVSKTTSAGHIAFYLSRFGPTLMIDGDPQGSLSLWMGKGEEDQVLAGLEGRNPDPYKVRENLFLLGTSRNSTLREWSDFNLPRKQYAVVDLLEEARRAGFLYVVVDLHPEVTAFLERRFLSAVDEVIPVMLAERFSVDGLGSFISALDHIRKEDRSSFRINRIIISRVNKAFGQHNAYVEVLKKRDTKIHVIGQSQKIPDAQIHNLFVSEYDSKNLQGEAYKQIAGDIHEKH